SRVGTQEITASSVLRTMLESSELQVASGSVLGDRMSGRITWIALIFWVLLPAHVVLAAQSPAHPAARKSGRASAHSAPVLPPLPPGPLPQVSMNDLPSVAPEVTYRDGLLTIAAKNSTLSDILHEVHQRTGATIDVPANATERVATRIGPGPVRDV